MSKRSCASFIEASRLSTSRLVLASRSVSAASVSQLEATPATSASSALRRPASLASTWACAASPRLARRPNRSISQPLTCRPAV